MILRKLILLGIVLAILTCNSSKATAAIPTVFFNNATPKAGSAAGKIDVDIEWKNCTAASSMEGSLYKVTIVNCIRVETIVSTKSVLSIAANGTKSWTWDGLTTGDVIVVYADVYDACNNVIVEKKSGDVTVP